MLFISACQSVNSCSSGICRIYRKFASCILGILASLTSNLIQARVNFQERTSIEQILLPMDGL